MYKYATKIDKEKHIKALGLALPVSTKHCVEISRYLRGRKVQDAILILEATIDKKHAIPFKRHLRDLPHRPGIGPGRYPEKACKEIMKVLQGAIANAQFKGMSISNLYIKHICAHLASRPWHYGRQTRRKAKRTHLEVVLEEREVKKEKKAEKVAKPKEVEKPKSKKPAEPKAEPKKVEKKVGPEKIVDEPKSTEPKAEKKVDKPKEAEKQKVEVKK